jgi:2-polyprenyl-3-methyl-5-hydroxy-6-metoxy-1,4-benzoquinol methylase
MYKSESSDLIVKYYDQAFGRSGEHETAWYLDKAQTFGGPVLDLACGTGRLAIYLAQEGFAVAAVDRSTGMLQQFNRKLRQQPQEVQNRIRIVQASMTEFDLGMAFNTILCCDAFFHNLTVTDQIACLRRVASHLAPEGRFVFNLPNPTCDFILEAQQSQGRRFAERGRYPLAGGDMLLVEHAQAAIPLEQTITTTLRFTRFAANGEAAEWGESSWTTRYIFRYEMEHLLARCGFEVEQLVGDYMNGPLTEKGQLIFQVRHPHKGLQ